MLRRFLKKNMVIKKTISPERYSNEESNITFSKLIGVTTSNIVETLSW